MDVKAYDAYAICLDESKEEDDFTRSQKLFSNYFKFYAQRCINYSHDNENKHHRKLI